jgi:hypothetical protein
MTTTENTLTVQHKSEKTSISSYQAPRPGIGAEDIAADEITLSFIKIIQKTSAEFDSKEADMGDFFDTVTRQNFGKSITVDILMKKSRWLKFDANNKLEKQSDDGFTWDTGEKMSERERWEFKKTYFFVIFKNVDSFFPSILSIGGKAKTTRMTAQNVINMLAKFTRGMDSESIFARSYTFYTAEEKGEKGTYAVIKYRMEDGFNPKDRQEFYMAIRTMLTSKSGEIIDNLQSHDRSEDDIPVETTDIKTSTLNPNLD